MAFKVKTTVWSQIVVDTTVLLQVFHFQYMCCDIAYDFDKYVEQKLDRFQAICETIVLDTWLVGNADEVL